MKEALAGAAVGGGVRGWGRAFGSSDAFSLGLLE